MKDLFVDYWPAIHSVALAGLGVVAWWVDARTKEKIDAAVNPLKLQLAALSSRVDEVEADVDGLPSKADLARVEGEVQAINREVRIANAGIERLEGYFLQRGVERS